MLNFHISVQQCTTRTRMHTNIRHGCDVVVESVHKQIEHRRIHVKKLLSVWHHINCGLYRKQTLSLGYREASFVERVSLCRCLMRGSTGK